MIVSLERVEKFRGRMGPRGGTFLLTPTDTTELVADLALGESGAASSPHESSAGRVASQDGRGVLPLLGARAGVRETGCITRQRSHIF
jgi:hypothetical protein